MRAPLALMALVLGMGLVCPPAAGADESDAVPARRLSPADFRPEPGFFFGSYGRVIAAGDLAGRSGRSTDFVRHGPRVDETSYAELQFRREDRFGDISSRVVFTLALLGPFFHFDGDANEQWAVRQLFTEAEHVGLPGLAAWAGSRIVRGDDVYLLDFWPLDNMNLVGGGLRYGHRDWLETLVHVGLYRLRDQYQHQVIDVPARTGFLPESIELLDRPRTVLATRTTWWPTGRYEKRGLKVVGYGELHALPAGERRGENDVTETLPADRGSVAGLQLGGWDAVGGSFFNVFVRHGRGLGAFNPLESPFRTGTVTTTELAREFQVAAVGNLELGRIGTQFGAYYRSFRSPAVNVLDGGTVAEGVVAVRPHLWLSRFAGVAAEASYQALARSALDEATGLPERGGVWKFALMPFVSPAGRGTYTRPHIRLIYAATVRDAGAQALYAVQDERSRRPVEHFLGVGAEWWFDSSYR